MTLVKVEKLIAVPLSIFLNFSTPAGKNSVMLELSPCKVYVMVPSVSLPLHIDEQLTRLLFVGEEDITWLLRAGDIS
jgi:hypothetical protein